MDSLPSSLRIINRLRRTRLHRLLPTSLKQSALRFFGIRYSSEPQLLEVALPSGVDGTVLLPNDPYWSYYIDQIDTYEPEVKACIDRLLGPETVFLDCGANAGLWSAYASRKAGDSRRVIAVEPTGELFDILSKNQRHCNGAFRTIQAAVWTTDGAELSFNTYKSHAANSLKQNRNSEGELRPVQRILTVSTVSIDGVLCRLREELGRNVKDVLVKLDVEGVEIEALQGAAEALKTTSFKVIYEDHGKDKSSSVTRYIMEALSLSVYAFDHQKSTFRRMERLEDVNRMKVNPAMGYNLLACSGDL